MAKQFVRCPRCSHSQMVQDIVVGSTRTCINCGKVFMPPLYNSWARGLLTRVFWVSAAASLAFIVIYHYSQQLPEPAAKPQPTVAAAPAPPVRKLTPARSYAVVPPPPATPVESVPETVPAVANTPATQPAEVIASAVSTVKEDTAAIATALRKSFDGVDFPALTAKADDTKVTNRTKLVGIEQLLLHDPLAIGVRVFNMNKSHAMLQHRTTFFTHKDVKVAAANALTGLTIGETHHQSYAHTVNMTNEWFAIDLANADLAGIDLENGVIARIDLFYQRAETANRIAQQSYASGLGPKWKAIPLPGGATILELAATPLNFTLIPPTVIDATYTPTRTLDETVPQTINGATSTGAAPARVMMH